MSIPLDSSPLSTPQVIKRKLYNKSPPQRSKPLILDGLVVVETGSSQPLLWRRSTEISANFIMQCVYYS
jgi:hypothetical protein